MRALRKYNMGGRGPGNEGTSPSGSDTLSYEALPAVLQYLTQDVGREQMLGGGVTVEDVYTSLNFDRPRMGMPAASAEQIQASLGDRSNYPSSTEYFREYEARLLDRIKRLADMGDMSARNAMNYFQQMYSDRPAQSGKITQNKGNPKDTGAFGF